MFVGIVIAPALPCIFTPPGVVATEPLPASF
jgi:hypothetical protein